MTVIFWVPEKKQLFIEEDILRNGNGNGKEKSFPLSLHQGPYSQCSRKEIPNILKNF